MVPLDAISLAAAVLQFVDFGSKLMIESYNVYHSESGATEDSDALTLATTILRDLAFRLQIPQYAKTTTDELALHNLARGCETLAQELLNILAELEVSPSSIGATRTWETVKKTIKRHVKADRIVKIERRLDTMRRDFSNHLLAILQYLCLPTSRSSSADNYLETIKVD
jgi:hypothetical protein